MNQHLLTLQDHDISLRSASDVLVRSPGFACVSGKTPLFGDVAREQARLNPTQSFNQFWHQLSLDPLPVKNKHFRHSADLAHGHLQNLLQGLSLTDDVILAAPSHYTRNQLAVLLGLLRSFEFRTTGLVDLALLQAIASDSPAQVIVIVDLQLHQAVLTSFHREGSVLIRDRVVQVPASGLLALQDAWTNMITDEFIRQTRFDPKHNAETEQYLYNQLPQWMTASAASNELLLELNHKGSVHQARITHEGFSQRSANIFARINKELSSLVTPDSMVHILRSQLHLPGLTSGLPGIIGLDDSRLSDACQLHADQITSDPAQLQFVTRLNLTNAQALAAGKPRQHATHIVLNHQGIALPEGRLALGNPASDQQYSRTLPWPALGADSAIVLNRKGRNLRLQIQEPSSIWVNGASAENGMQLYAGDTINTSASADPSALLLIAVE